MSCKKGACLDETANDKVVCNCVGVTKSQIIESIRKGNNTVEKIGDDTQAGTICGVCVDEIQEIINENK